ncbi:hypothetical protein HDU81_000889 [Chytriomyces hyalinus]|nr:hypothetical protein HDU81_000889 [Chytriomyces hyalinus]
MSSPLLDLAASSSTSIFVNPITALITDSFQSPASDVSPWPSRSGSSAATASLSQLPQHRLSLELHVSQKSREEARMGGLSVFSNFIHANSTGPSTDSLSKLAIVAARPLHASQILAESRGRLNLKESHAQTHLPATKSEPIKITQSNPSSTSKRNKRNSEHTATTKRRSMLGVGHQKVSAEQVSAKEEPHASKSIREGASQQSSNTQISPQFAQISYKQVELDGLSAHDPQFFQETVSSRALSPASSKEIAFSGLEFDCQETASYQVSTLESHSEFDTLSLLSAAQATSPFSKLTYTATSVKEQPSAAYFLLEEIKSTSRTQTQQQNHSYALGRASDTSSNWTNKPLKQSEMNILDLGKTVTSTAKSKSARAIRSQPVVWMKTFINTRQLGSQNSEDVFCLRPKTASETLASFDLDLTPKRPTTSVATSKPSTSRAEVFPAVGPICDTEQKDASTHSLPPKIPAKLSSSEIAKPLQRPLPNNEGIPAPSKSFFRYSKPSTTDPEKKVALKPRISSGLMRIAKAMSGSSASVLQSTMDHNAGEASATPKVHPPTAIPSASFFVSDNSESPPTHQSKNDSAQDNVSKHPGPQIPAIQTKFAHLSTISIDNDATAVVLLPATKPNKPNAKGKNLQHSKKQRPQQTAATRANLGPFPEVSVTLDTISKLDLHSIDGAVADEPISSESGGMQESLQIIPFIDDDSDVHDSNHYAVPAEGGPGLVAPVMTRKVKKFNSFSKIEDSRLRVPNHSVQAMKYTAKKPPPDECVPVVPLTTNKSELPSLLLTPTWNNDARLEPAGSKHITALMKKSSRRRARNNNVENEVSNFSSYTLAGVTSYNSVKLSTFELPEIMDNRTRKELRAADSGGVMGSSFKRSPLQSPQNNRSLIHSRETLLTARKSLSLIEAVAFPKGVMDLTPQASSEIQAKPLISIDKHTGRSADELYRNSKTLEDGYIDITSLGLSDDEFVVQVEPPESVLNCTSFPIIISADSAGTGSLILGNETIPQQRAAPDSSLHRPMSCFSRTSSVTNLDAQSLSPWKTKTLSRAPSASIHRSIRNLDEASSSAMRKSSVLLPLRDSSTGKSVVKTGSKFATAFSMVHYQDDQQQAVRIKLPFKKHCKIESWLQLMIEHAFLIYQSIRRIQRIWRGSILTKKYRIRRIAAKTIQRFFRGFRVRKAYLKAQQLSRLKSATPTHRLSPATQLQLDSFVKEMKLLSRNFACANEDDVYESDRAALRRTNVRDAMRAYISDNRTRRVSELSRVGNKELNRVWDQFGAFFTTAVSKYLNAKNLSLMMHISGSYGRGFQRLHVSLIVETIREKSPQLLKERKAKSGNTRVIAGIQQQTTPQDDENGTGGDDTGVDADETLALADGNV